MASVTPLTALPASGTTPAGTLTTSAQYGILTATLSGSPQPSSSAKLYLITRAEGGAWKIATDENGNDVTLTVSGSDPFPDNTSSLIFANPSVSSLYNVILQSGSAPVNCYLSAVTSPGASNTLIAHASTHLAGGSDDLLGAPGTVGGGTPGVFCGTFGADSSHQNSVPSVNGSTFVLAAGAQTLASKTLTSPVISTGLTASGSASNDFSASTGTFKTSTGAATIGGGAAAIGITSSAAAVTITAGAASTFSTTSGALNVDGTSGVVLKVGGTTIADAGATSATKFTVAANTDLNGAAGTGGLTLGGLTGVAQLPSGNLSWAGAANKTLSLVASGTGTAVIDSGAAWTLGATTGTTGTIGRTGQTVTLPGLTVHTQGVTNSSTLTQTGVATFNAAPVFAAGLTASGAVANDFSGATGTFLTSTGLNTIGGDLLMASGKVVGFGAPQALSGAGAVNVTTLATLFTSTGAAQALTLADGTRAGQVKFIMHVVDGGSGVLTPTTATNFTTVTFTNVYDWCALIWSGTAWRPLAYSGAVFA